MAGKWKVIGTAVTVPFVGTAVAELAPLHDIVGPWAVRSWSAPLVFGITAAVVMVGLLLAWIFFRKRREAPTPLPREVAQRALDALRDARLSPYEASVKVSDILRRFIHDEYGLDAINKTSMEFLNSLQPSTIFSEKTVEDCSSLRNSIEVLLMASRPCSSWMKRRKMSDTFTLAS